MRQNPEGTSEQVGKELKKEGELSKMKEAEMEQGLREQILVINPGSTSTKIAVFAGEDQLFDETLRHPAQQLLEYESIADQRGFRKQLVLDALKEHGVAAEELTAVCCRGGLIRPVPGGTYRISEAMLKDCREETYGQHASNLGALIGHELQEQLGIPAFVVDPPSVDELAEKARFSGHPVIRRTSLFHALNQKAVARRYAEEKGCRYEELNLLVCHMGGGISVGAHLHGRVVDTENAVGGEGPFSPGRAGSMPVNEIIELCFSGEHDREEIMEMMVGEGGLFAYTGTTSVRELLARAEDGDAETRQIMEAFCYQIAKEIAAMSAALRGRVDQIILTGGIAYSDVITDYLRSQVEWIAPVTVYPGEDEMRALAGGALRVLRGEEEAREYR